MENQSKFPSPQFLSAKSGKALSGAVIKLEGDPVSQKRDFSRRD